MRKLTTNGNVTPLAAAAEATPAGGRRAMTGLNLMPLRTLQPATPELRLRKVDQEASGSMTRTATTTVLLSALNRHPDTSHSAALSATRAITPIKVVKESSQLVARGVSNVQRPISQSRVLSQTPQTHRRAGPHGGTTLTSPRAAHPTLPPIVQHPCYESYTHILE